MWDYSEKVMEHFLHPHNAGEIPDADAVGEVGNASCGDALKLTLKVDEKTGRITDARFKTFGCASAIASSSALTDLIRGMTLEEAEKVTNRDIVKLLGELPEEKMHCSVMGMEALQAAIKSYRGESSGEAEKDEGTLICKCFGVTDSKIREVARANNLRTAGQITNYCKAGGACGACLESIQDILDDMWREAGEGKPSGDRAAEFAALGMVQKIFRIQEVLDKEIKPLLEKDGGSVELADFSGLTVKVKLTGRCAGCPASGVTIKHTVEDKLREFVSPELNVESI